MALLKEGSNWVVVSSEFKSRVLDNEIKSSSIVLRPSEETKAKAENLRKEIELLDSLIDSKEAKKSQQHHWNPFQNVNKLRPAQSRSVPYILGWSRLSQYEPKKLLEAKKCSFSQKSNIKAMDVNGHNKRRSQLVI